METTSARGMSRTPPSEGGIIAAGIGARPNVCVAGGRRAFLGWYGEGLEESMKTLALLAVLLAAPQGRVLLADELHTEVIEYKQGDTVLEGYLACPKEAKGKLPGVVIVH